MLSLPKIPYINRIYMFLANPTQVGSCALFGGGVLSGYTLFQQKHPLLRQGEAKAPVIKVR